MLVSHGSNASSSEWTLCAYPQARIAGRVVQVLVVGAVLRFFKVVVKANRCTANVIFVFIANGTPAKRTRFAVKAWHNFLRLKPPGRTVFALGSVGNIERPLPARPTKSVSSEARHSCRTQITAITRFCSFRTRRARLCTLTHAIFVAIDTIPTFRNID